jgi:hypothetical protein
LPKAQWVEAQKAKLLACDHFHVVFTLPHELLDVWRYNRHWFTKAMFASSRDTLFELLGEDRYLGASPGVIMSFHSWGRTLSLHPHVHCLVTGGGLTTAGEWREVKNGYLLPAKVAKAVYRGKLLAALAVAISADELVLPKGMTPDSLQALMRRLYRKEWNVRIQERYTHGQGVMLYLSRYVRGGPIQEHRIAYRGGDRVSFSYTDHRDQQSKRMTLTPHAFMTRILTHVPEPSQHQIRYYGLYHPKQQQGRAGVRVQFRQSAEQKGASIDRAGFLAQQGRRDATVCPHCGKVLVSQGHFGRNRNSYNRVHAMIKSHGSVQQAVRVSADRRQALFFAATAALLN